MLMVRAGLRALRRGVARRRVGRVGLEGPRGAVLGRAHGDRAVHAAGPQEQRHLDRSQPRRERARDGQRRLAGADM